MDKEQLESLVGSMTDEQLLALIQGADKQEKTPEPIKVALPDGSTVEGKDQEEVNKLLRAKLETAMRAPKAEEPPPVQNPQTPPKWDYETFSKKFVADPREGMEYYEMSNYGMPVGKAVPQLLAAVIQLAQKVQTMEQDQFATAVPDEAERRAAEQILKERGWQTSRQSLQDALDIAKGRGMVKAQESAPAEKPRTFIPPRTSRTNSSEADVTTQEIIRAASEMPVDKLEDILIAKGLLTRRS